MADRFHTPLSGANWRKALQGLVLACSGATPPEQAECLRGLRDTVSLAPDAAPLDGVRGADPVMFERLLDMGAYESAALSLLGRRAGYMLSGRGIGESLATVVLPGQDGDTHAPGATVALALVGAIAQALLCAWDAARESTQGVPLGLALN